jgi:alkylhydroperoxidase/carboxymuconolactone decarboxylase family protein YurZ
MAELTVTITDTQLKGLEYIALSPQEWADNAITERARIAVDEIIQMYTNRALNEGVQIPATRELIVADAFTRGWAQTAAERQAAMQAEDSTEE